MRAIATLDLIGINDGWRRGGGEGKIYPGNRLHSSPKLLRLLNGDSSLGIR